MEDFIPFGIAFVAAAGAVVAAIISGRSANINLALPAFCDILE